MRKIYLILNIIFITAVVILLNAYAGGIQSSVDTLNKRPLKRNKLNKKIKIRNRQVIIPDENLISILTNSNLFEVNRGEETVVAKKSSGTRTKYNFKLMGVCHFGKLKGAIITNSSRNRASSGKSYFTIGEEVGDGFKLYDITSKTAILKNGTRKISLELAKAENKPQRRTRTRRQTRISRQTRTRRR